jgi:glycosyltransferase involved in cell wall biosynthesis
MKPALVTFAIPVRRPVSTVDREHLDRILTLTLRSIFAQTDGDFRVLAAMAHQPDLPDFVDERFQVLDVGGWFPSNWHDANIEAGHRRHALTVRFAALGGGYLMLCDCDDFISKNLVAHVRRTMHPNGYKMHDGYIFDATANTIAPYPTLTSPGTFHEFCGSSSLLKLTPSEILDHDADGRNFFDRAYGGWHHKVVARMQEMGRPLSKIPFPAAAYLRNSGNNLSLFADGLADALKREGIKKLDAQNIANRLHDDTFVRQEFSIPDRYPQAPSIKYIDVPAHRAETPTASVLICTHRRPEGLRCLLQALISQIEAGKGHEIIVINDGTHSPAYEAVLAPFTNKIHYRALEKNVGVAAARNISASIAKNDYLVFTDDDTIPQGGWLDWLLMRLMEHPELDVVAGTTKPLWPEKPSFFAKVRAEHDLIPTTEDTGGTIIFPTANVAIRRTLFEEMGGFGFPDFSGAGEDTELATRLFRRGSVMRADRNWATQHEITEGLWRLCKRYRRYGYANGRLALLTTSPAEHDYMLDTGHAGWRTIWDWEYAHLIKHARSVHKSRLVATASATLACIVKMAYWRGIKDALRLLPVS